MKLKQQIEINDQKMIAAANGTFGVKCAAKYDNFMVLFVNVGILKHFIALQEVHKVMEQTVRTV